jgi:hypothetical protein
LLLAVPHVASVRWFQPQASEVQGCHLKNLSLSSLLPPARTTWMITADGAPTASYQRRGSLS